MKKIILLLSLLTFMNCSNKEDSQNNTIPGNFAHTVYFWLKNPTNEVDKAAFERSLKGFIDKSQYIKTKHIGVPAKTNRDVIDTTYTYSLLLTFASKNDQDKYQEEPNHKKFIAESSKLWMKVIVYDSENTYD